MISQVKICHHNWKLKTFEAITVKVEALAAITIANLASLSPAGEIYKIRVHSIIGNIGSSLILQMRNLDRTANIITSLSRFRSQQKYPVGRQVNLTRNACPMNDYSN